MAFFGMSGADTGSDLQTGLEAWAARLQSGKTDGISIDFDLASMRRTGNVAKISDFLAVGSPATRGPEKAMAFRVIAERMAYSSISILCGRLHYSAHISC
jgi:hypothetical protein